MPKLVILGAAYGLADVTVKVRALVRDNGLTVTADNDTFAESPYGEGKTLVIVYQYDHVAPQVLVAPQGEVALIPPNTAVGPPWQPQPDGQLTILGAAFGTADVTDDLRRIVTDNRLTVCADASLLPETPTGADNTLVVVYQYHGVPELWIAKQNERFQIEDCAVADEATPITRALLDAVGGDHGAMARKTYDFTTGNTLTLFQTPGVWGSNISPAGPTKASEALLSAIHEAVIRAEHGVDIATLWPLPSGRFFDALRGALVELARRNAPVTVRVLAGKPVGIPGVPFAPIDPTALATEWLERLTDGLPGDCALQIYLAAAQTRPFTWNHAKILAVDGQVVFVGGHNLWHDDYLRAFPVHDISASARGRAALVAHLFADHLWENVRQQVGEEEVECRSWTWCWSNGEISKPETYPDINWRAMAAPNTDDGSPILTVGNFAAGIEDSSAPGYNASTTALVTAVSQAERSIKLSQQNLYFLTRANEPFISALAQRIVTRCVQVDVVLTDDAALFNNTHTTIAQTYSWIYEAVRKLDPEFPRSEFSQFLRIAPLRTTDRENEESGRWLYRDPENGQTRTAAFANHAKVVIVDDKAYYLGSENVYPCDLQEMGFFIEDEAQTQVLLSDYWNELWRYSSQWLYEDAKSEAGR